MTGNRWLILAVLFFARTAIAYQFQSVAAVSPLLVDALLLDLALLGGLIGAWMLPGMIFAFPGGLLGQRFGDKQTVVVSLALMAAGSAIVALADSYAIAMTGRVVSGVGAVVLNVLLTKMVADWFSGRELSTAMAVLVSSWPFGIGLALVTLGPLSAAYGWRQAIAVTAYVALVALLAIVAAYRAPAQPTATKARSQWRWSLSSREVMLVTIAGLLWAFYNVGYIVLVSFAPMLLTEGAGGAAKAAIVASFATWPVLLSVPLGGVLADRTGRGFLIMTVSIMATAVTLPLIFASGSPLVMLIVIGLLFGPAAGIIMAMPASVLDAGSRHAGMGLFYTIYYLAMTFLPGVAGALRDRTGIAIAPLLFGSAVLIAAVLCALAFRMLQARWQPQADARSITR